MNHILAFGRRRRIILLASLMGVIVLLTLAIPVWGRYQAQRNSTGLVDASAAAPAPSSGTMIDPPRPMPDWTLTSHTGKPLRLSDLRGKAVLLFFGYTSCPDVCPTTLSDFAQVKRSLGNQGDHLAVVFISVDSKRDTPDRLARYVTSFDPDFLAATGDETTLQLMGKEYGLDFAIQPPTGSSTTYTVDHSAASYLLDPQGRERVIYSFNTPPDVVVRDVRAVLP